MRKKRRVYSVFKIFSAYIWIYKMQRLEVRGAVRPLYGSLGVKGLRQLTSASVGWINKSSIILKCSNPELLPIHHLASCYGRPWTDTFCLPKEAHKILNNKTNLTSEVTNSILSCKTCWMLADARFKLPAGVYDANLVFILLYFCGR